MFVTKNSEQVFQGDNYNYIKKIFLSQFCITLYIFVAKYPQNIPKKYESTTNISIDIYFFFIITAQAVALKPSSSSEDDERKSTDEKNATQEPSTSIQSMELECEPGPSTSPKLKRKRASREFITTKLVAAFDRCKVSDRDAVHILIATAEALHHDVHDLIINRSSIRRCRERLREEHASKIRHGFDQTEISALTVHWDGKMLPALMKKELVDRLPVIVTYNGVEQLLGVPQIESGTGRDQALAVYNTLQEWNLADRVQALCCDTTASNTGRLKGACILLEKELGRNILYFPCRHHIYELILRSVFDTKLDEKSTSPNVQLFKRFQQSWSKFNLLNFKSGMEDQSVIDKLSVLAEDTKQFAMQNVQEHHPREDYRELLELTIIFLGGLPPRGISFRVPGAFHHARWMAKAIYCLKIFLFRKEFTLTEEEETGIRDVCVFLVTLYVKAWINAPNSIEAPRQDLEFLKNLFEYKNDLQISQITIAKFCNHLWYLAPETAALAFFDGKVSDDTKKKMVQALKSKDTLDMPSGEIKKITMLPKNVKNYINKGLEQFIHPLSNNFFKRFNIETKFLDKDPSTWKNDKSYNAGLKIVKSLKVVNDSAERGVKLMEDFNNLFTKNEPQKQFVLQVVSDYRRKYSDSNKKTLLKEF